jgi:hypothetical protein
MVAVFFARSADRRVVLFDEFRHFHQQHAGSSVSVMFFSSSSRSVHSAQVGRMPERAAPRRRRGRSLAARRHRMRCASAYFMSSETSCAEAAFTSTSGR